MSHTLKVFERIINHRLRNIVELGNIHFVFRRGIAPIDLVGLAAIKFLSRNVQREATRFAHCIHIPRKSINALLSHQVFDMEHQANDRDSRGVRQCDTGHVQMGDD